VPWYGGDSQGVEASESQADASSPTYLGPFEIEDDPGPADSSDDEEEKDDDTNVGIYYPIPLPNYPNIYQEWSPPLFPV